MKRFSVLFILFVTLNCSLIAQDSILISGRLKGNTRFAKVIVKKFGVGVFDIAAVIIKNQEFSIKAPVSIEPGVYRFQYSQSSLSEYVDLIINGYEKEINFVLDVSQDKRMPVFTKSVENQNWYAWKQYVDSGLRKIGLLYQIVEQYPDTTEVVYRILLRTFNKAIKSFWEKRHQFVTRNETSWAGLIMKNTPYCFAQPCDLPQLQDSYRKRNYWQGINTTLPSLINTPLYTDLILGYLKYYMNPEIQFSETEMNERFKNCVDTVMLKFSDNEQTRQFAFKYLQLGFKEVGNEKIAQYINQTYNMPLQRCDDNDMTKEQYENRMVSYDNMKLGAQAPELTFVGADGRPYGMKEIPNKYLILVFWASWCPKCQIEMPKLEVFVQQNPEYASVAISLDEDYDVYYRAIKQYPSLIHDCDFQKWQGKAAKEYFIAASPTFILLNSERKIVGKYSGFESMLEEIR